ncbi:MAG TPA: hypothetical protein VKG22_10400 [Stellaceae bacterium]|nr:hypothetical protein [Stellaceae bacterium]HMD67042.1 hypothetical protein [Stellaceae bacterium]
MPAQLTATIHQAEITSNLRASNVVAALIADRGDEVGWRYVEFVTANIRNPPARRVMTGPAAPSRSPLPRSPD